MAVTGMLPWKFDYTAPGASGGLIFLDRSYGTSSRFTSVSQADLSTSARTNIITLPNGTRFDPHQTYQAPRQLGDITFTVEYVRKGETGASPFEAVYTIIYNAVGWPGALYYKGNVASLTASCAARLREVQTGWSGYKYDTVHDRGLPLQRLTVTFIFDQITDWA